MLATDRPTLSIVVPVYRSAECLVELAARVNKACQSIGVSHELILVDDCSPDHSWQVIEGLCASDPSVVGITLRKNVGQDNAIMAGFNSAQGGAVVVMDDDLQHDPDDMGALLSKLQQGGHDVVYAKYKQTHQKLWKNLGSWFNGRVAQVVLGKPRDIYLSPYKILLAEVVSEIIRYRGPYPYVDGLIFRTTSNIGQVTVEHHPRFKGQGSYTFWRSLAVWARLCTNFSVVPLRLATITGGVSAGAGLSTGLGFLLYRLLINPSYGAAQEGWVSVIVSILFLGGIQLLTIGMLGEYVGQMHLNINSRPQYVQKVRLSRRAQSEPRASERATESSPLAAREAGSAASAARRAARDS
jgi:undecaprenyl-phosphate 4-deoxy-4-formamido-L-arabinose transferase